MFHGGLIKIKCFKVDYLLTARWLAGDQTGLRANCRGFLFPMRLERGGFSPLFTAATTSLDPPRFRKEMKTSLRSEGLRVESFTWQGIAPFVMSQSGSFQNCISNSSRSIEGYVCVVFSHFLTFIVGKPRRRDAILTQRQAATLIEENPGAPEHTADPHWLCEFARLVGRNLRRLNTTFISALGRPEGRRVKIYR